MPKGGKCGVMKLGMEGDEDATVRVNMPRGDYANAASVLSYVRYSVLRCISSLLLENLKEGTQKIKVSIYLIMCRCSVYAHCCYLCLI